MTVAVDAAELERHLPEFETAILSALDAEGYPFSVRCSPELDAREPLVRVSPIAGVTLTPGPASLLCHSHDEQLSQLRSFLVRGRLEKTSDVWVFRPQKFVPGAGVAGRLATLRTVLAIRRRASRYLAARGLSRPQISWERIVAAKERAQKARG